jgi:hypothetical protein
LPGAFLDHFAQRRRMNGRPSMSRGILFKHIAVVLTSVWDPIRIAGEPGTEDEYDVFVAPVAKLLFAGKTAVEIAETLISIERRELGLPGDPDRARKAAEASKEAFEKWRAAFQRAAVPNPADHPVRFGFSANALRFFRHMRHLHREAGDDADVLVLWIGNAPPSRPPREWVVNHAWFTADAIARRGGRIRDLQGLRVVFDVPPGLAALLDGSTCDVIDPEGPAVLVRSEWSPSE